MLILLKSFKNNIKIESTGSLKAEALILEIFI